MAASDVLTILMTAPDPGVGEQIVRQLLDERLVACGNVIPGAISLYRWDGEIQRDQEALVILKTARTALQDALARAEEVHPYEVPELLVLEVADGSAPYVNWVVRECR